MDNDLAVTPSNLLAAHGAFSGSDQRLARKIVQRQSSGAAIDQAWLDQEVDSGNGVAEQDEQLQTIISKLDRSIVSFADTTRSARTATAKYSSQLQHHVDLASDADTTGHMISGLVDLARAMLDRNREVEEDFRRSEREAESLRKSLAKAQREAEIDHLTGLPNRRAFEGLLQQQHREAKAAIEPLCVAFCDIDHFKAVNDSHGHDAGDRVIQAVAQLLARITNDKCHVARHGGEEFVMLFRGFSRQEVFARLDNARESMAARRLINRVTDEPIGQITFSGGIADVFAYPSPRDALRAADEALYRAKESGRNRIELA